MDVAVGTRTLFVITLSDLMSIIHERQDHLQQMAGGQTPHIPPSLAVSLVGLLVPPSVEQCLL